MAFLDDKSPHNTRFCWPQSCDGEKAVSPFYLKFQYFLIFWIWGKFVISLKRSKNPKHPNHATICPTAIQSLARGLDLLDVLDFPQGNLINPINPNHATRCPTAIQSLPVVWIYWIYWISLGKSNKGGWVVVSLFVSPSILKVRVAGWWSLPLSFYR